MQSNERAMYDYVVIAADLLVRLEQVEFQIENHYEPTLMAQCDEVWADVMVFKRNPDAIRYLQNASKTLRSLEKTLDKVVR